MFDAFDPYYKWLGIPAEEQPPNHYRLLGVMLFEADPEVIESAADRQMAHVRSFQGGKHASESQQVLNELSAARLCLLSADKKVAYDQTLKAKLAPAQALAGSPQVKAAAKPVATPIKPLRVAQAATPLRPTPVATPPENSLGIDPLASSMAPRHRKRKSTSQQPALFVGIGAAVVAVIGLVWALAGNSDDPPAQLTSKPSAADDHKANGSDRTDDSKPPADHAPNPKRVDPLAADTPKPIEYAPADSADDSAENSSDEPSDNVDMATDAAEPLDEVMDSVMPGDSGDTGLDSGEPASVEPDDAPAKPPLPDADALKAAIAEIQSLLKADFSAAKKPDQRIALAKKLLGLAKDSDAPTERYALLSEAQRLAASAGDAGLAMQAIDAEAEEFAVHRLELAADMLDSLASKELPAAARKELVEVILPLVDEAAAAGQFKSARRLAAVGLAVARKASATDAAKTLARQAHELAAQEKLAEAADAARKQLAEKPDDSDAHLTLGKYLCLVAGDWDTGLSHLKQGSDPALRSIAERELTGAETAADQVKLGDLWWDLSDEQKGIDKDRYRTRAGHWYEQAIRELTGLSKAKVEKRLADIPTGPATAPARPSIKGLPIDHRRLATIYLSDLKPEEVWTSAAEPLHGGAPISFGGDLSPHGLFTHPLEGRAHVSFQLPEGCQTFTGKVGINHSLDPGVSIAPLTFRVVADGKELWKSRPLNVRDESQDFQISLDGAHKLELFVAKDASSDNWAHAVWFEPKLTQAGSGARTPRSNVSKSVTVGKWIDLLPLADPGQQHLEMAWRRTAAGLRVDKSQTPIQLPITLQGDYALHVEFTRAFGSDAVYVVFPTAPSRTAMLLSGWNGEASGLDGVNGRASRENETAVRPGALVNDHRYSLDITVRRAQSQVTVDVDLDGKAYVRWKGDPDVLGFTTRWMPQWDTIGLAANEPTDFHVAKFKLLSGKATIDVDAVSHPATPKASAQTSEPTKGSRLGNVKIDLLKGAVLIATFDEPTIVRQNGEVRVRDLSGTQKPGLIVGATLLPGQAGRALGFEKIGDHVDFGNDPSLNPPNFTFCAWIKPTAYKNVLSDIFSKHGEDKGCSGLVVRFQGDRPKFGIGIGDGNWHYLEQGTAVPLNQSAHLAATHDNNTSAIYINGQLAKSARSDGPVVPTTQRCLIGMTLDHDELQFYGLIDELALFDRALSAAEVQQIYQLGVKGKSLASAGKK